MELEKQVVSLELAKKLKDLGVKQESLFYWVDYTDGYSEPSWNLNSNHIGYKYHLPAYSVGQLGEMLRKYDVYSFYDGEWNVLDMEGGYLDKRGKGEIGYGEIVADTEADARAKMLIYLIENGLVELGELGELGRTKSNRSQV